MNNTSDRKKRRAAFIAALVIFVVLAVACVVYLAVFTPFFRGGGTPSDTGSAGHTVPVPATGSDEPDDTDAPLPDNPIDFAAQKEINPDIYAWINIPGTVVDYPVLQSPEDDLYYLRRGLDRKYDVGGVIFSQSHNSLDFTDPVTVLYGHDMRGYGEGMFAALHYFEDVDFFAEHEYFTVCIPGHVLSYRIVSAYKYDDRHIMNSFNFSDPVVVRQYFDYVMHPAMIPMNVREGVALEDDDRLVVLSTCMTDTNYRFLVNGVLIDDMPTK